MKPRRSSRFTSFTLAVLFLATACSQLPRNSKTLFVMVPKLVGIPYFNSARDGAAQEAGRLGLHFFYTGPTAADASLQVDVIAGLLARHPAVLAVSCDDANALTPVLRRARRYGIPVLTWDADAQPDARDWFVSQVEDETLGRHVMDVLAEQLGGRGQYAIITGSLTASNLNAWLFWMKKQQQEKYPEMQLVAVVAGNDDQQQSFVQAQSLLEAYPNLRGFIGNSSAAPPAIARAIEQARLAGQIAIVGLSTPNLMRHYLEDKTVKTITLWDPGKLGRLTAAVAAMLLRHETPHDGMDVPGVGQIRVFPETRKIVMGSPLDFTRENISQYWF
ncbi:MAG TPA: autoinducer 2 ABC transporter substrate-binding protein [Candidatus Acidoferrum sp.]